MKVQVEALKALLGPEDVDVDLRRILKEARDEQGRKIFETFSSNDMSFLVARWDKYKRAPWRQDPSASASDGLQASLGLPQEQLIVGWSQIEKKKRVTDAVEDYLANCAQFIVDIELVESLLRPEDLEVSLRYVLMHATYRAATSSSSSAHQKSRITLWQAEGDGWKVREETMRGRRMGETSGTTLGIKELRQKLRRAQQHSTDSSASAKLVVGQRRRRSLGSDGRKAKAKDCFREPGQGRAEVP